MTKIVAAISWQDQSDPKAPLAPYTLDFGADTTWNFSSLDGSYNQKRISPAGVIVDNSQNTVAVSLTCGPLAITINPADRQAIDLPSNSQSITFSSTSNTQKTPIAFYVKKPAPDAQGLNYLLAQQTVQAAIASQTLGTMNPIINSEFRIWPEGVSLLGTGAAFYTAEGWQFKSSANFTNSQKQGIIGTQYAMRLQRNAGSADVTAPQIGTALESSDSFQYVGATATLSFDVRFGSNFSGVGGNLVATIFGGTGTDENVFKPFTGQQTLGTFNVPSSATGTRVAFTTAAVIPAGVTQVGIQFQYTPSGVAGANDFVDVGRIQLDSGSQQSYRPVPYEIERERCLRFFQILNEDQQVSYSFAMGVGRGGAASFHINYQRKRAIPAITTLNLGNMVAVDNVNNVAPTAVGTVVPDVESTQYNLSVTTSSGAGVLLLSDIAGATAPQIKINARM